MAFQASASLKKGILFRWIAAVSMRVFVGDAAFTAGVGEISKDAQKLIDATEGLFTTGIEKMVAGNHLGDVSNAIQVYAESRGYYVTHEYTGHGVGREMHEGPMVPNFGTPGRGIVLKVGMNHRFGTHVIGRNGRDDRFTRPMDSIFCRSIVNCSL